MNATSSKLRSLLLFAFVFAVDQSRSADAAPSVQGAAAREDTSQAPAVTMMRMRDGSIEWGRVRGHDTEGITFERLENGGVVRLGWKLLDAEQE